VALLACSISGAAGASQAAPPASDKLQQAFGWMTGNWSCSGTFKASGKPISSDLRIEPILQNAWLSLAQDDRPPNQYHALALWTWSSDAGWFVSRILDMTGGDRLFTSSGWEGDKLTWNFTPEKSGNVRQRFIYTRRAAAFGYQYDMLRDAQWVTVDSLECTRQ
jgi:hypothetical protein